MEEPGPATGSSIPGEGQGVYLYCFTRAASTAHSAKADDRPDVQALARGDLAAVYTRVRLEEFTGPAGEANLQNPDWLVPRALQHEQVIEALLARAPVLPVRFGSVFSSSEGLAEFLQEHGAVIRQFLDGIAGKEEWALKVFLDMAKASAWLAAADPELAQRQRCLPAAPGARYFQEKQLRTDIQKKVRQWSGELAQQLEAELGFEQAAVRPLKLRVPDDAKGDMILHQAVLLPRAAVDNFRTRVAELGARHVEQGLVLESTGPWPPYSFCPAFAEKD